jgi:alanine dehydrogenase
VKADLLLKVKEPIAPEYGRLREGLVLFTYLHIAADEPLTLALLESGITAVAYETVETDSGALPLLAPMSEIAGRLAAQAGAYFSRSRSAAAGCCSAACPAWHPGRVVVIGGGMVGYNAPSSRSGLGANVTILERSIEPHAPLEEVLSGRVSLVMSSSLQIEESLRDADVVIGAVPHSRRGRPKLIHARDGARDEGRRGARRRRDRPGRLRRDVRPTTHSEPGLHRRGVTHYLRREHAGRVPITSTKALDETQRCRTSEAIADTACRGCRRDPRSRAASTCSTARSRTKPSRSARPRLQPLDDVCRRPRSDLRSFAAKI